MKARRKPGSGQCFEMEIPVASDEDAEACSREAQSKMPTRAVVMLFMQNAWSFGQSD